MRVVSTVLRAQGWYYLVGGLWPFVHYRSFDRVTGPKPDRFVTEVASALYAAIGLGLLGGRPNPPPSVRRLGLAAALASAGLDLRHRPALKPVHLLEAGIETVFITGLAAGHYRKRVTS